MNDFSSDRNLFPSNRSAPDSDPDSNASPGSFLFPHHWNYEATVAQVEAIINRIEMGELELAEVFDQFAIAVEHLRHCETFLGHQKQQMDLLIETLLDEEAF